MLANNYFIVYKPFQVLCQFSGDGVKKTLADIFSVPRNVYPVGRLDYDSEGLLILTDDKQLNALLLSPKNNHQREYYVQVEGEITDDAINNLCKGVIITIKSGSYLTQKCKAEKIQTPNLPDRKPPVRFRKTVPDSWIKIILTEGKNRQVRKMTAAVGFPTLRLIRYRIELISLDNMVQGEMKKISKQELYNLLQIK
ncbi:MAG: pseudouridine synthase [Bacteroidetes bacterium]|nr:pseudouridine synthase [Bacteroidota bacterium]